MRRNTLAFLVVFIVFFIFVTMHIEDLGLPVDIGNDLIQIIPGLLVTFFSFKGYHDSYGATRSLSLVTLGIGLALLVGTAYDMNIVSLNMLDGLTVAQLQTWIIIFGGVLAGIDFYRG